MRGYAIVCECEARVLILHARKNRLKLEDEKWTEVGSSYNAFRSQVLAELEERRKEFPSAKAKGKQRLSEEDRGEDVDLWDISEADLPEHFRGKEGLDLARSIAKGEEMQQDVVAARLAELGFTVSLPLYGCYTASLTVPFSFTDGPATHSRSLCTEDNTNRRNRPKPPLRDTQQLPSSPLTHPRTRSPSLIRGPILLPPTNDRPTTSNHRPTRPTPGDVEDRYHSAAGAGGRCGEEGGEGGAEGE